MGVETRWLGANQRICISRLANSSLARWFPGCGWIVGGSFSETRKVMENLRSKGLVEYQPAGTYWHKVYRLTDEGKKLEATWAEKIID